MTAAAAVWEIYLSEEALARAPGETHSPSRLRQSPQTARGIAPDGREDGAEPLRAAILDEPMGLSDAAAATTRSGQLTNPLVG